MIGLELLWLLGKTTVNLKALNNSGFYNENHPSSYYFYFSWGCLLEAM